jgi:uncharacterized UBP type Zn finger protein
MYSVEGRRPALASAITLVALASLFLAASAPAAAANRYGSIAFDKSTRAFGYSFNHDSREAAEADAVARCPGSNCQSMMWFANGCGALSVGRITYGAGSGATRASAIAKANSLCGRGDCEIRAVTCTDRRAY